MRFFASLRMAEVEDFRDWAHRELQKLIGGTASTMAMKKGTSERILADVPEDKVFWCYGSETFKNLHELAAALEHMSEEAFQHHVTKHKNDFSNWVRDVIGDTTLASQLRKAPTKSAAASKAKARIAWLKARM